MRLLLVIEVLFLAVETAEDIRNRNLELNRLLIFLILGLFLKIFWLHESIVDVISGMSVGLVFLLFSYISGEVIGYGDGMVILVTGVFCGIKRTVITVCIAFLFISVSAMFLFMRKGFFYKKEVPFVPCILAGFIGGMML